MRTLALVALLLGITCARASLAYVPWHLGLVQNRDSCGVACQLQGADLRNANLNHMDLSGAQLRGADLSGANLRGVNFEGADLRGANLQGANLTVASFHGANLDGADLTGAKMQGTYFEDASLRGTQLANTVVTEMLWADTSEAFGVPGQVATTPPAPPAANPDRQIGSVFLVSFPFCPEGTLEADGALLPVVDNQALFSLYGMTYGGQDAKSFNLPDLRQQVPLAGMRYCVVVNGADPPRP